MAELYTLEAKQRAELGSANCRRLRRRGLVPAVLYGKKIANVHLALDAAAFDAALRHHSRILDLKLPDGRVEKAIIKEVQYDTLGDHVLHVDLGRIALDEKIEVAVPLKFVGEPKGAAAGGHLEVVVHEVRVECLAGAIPDELRIDVSHLELGQILRAKDVQSLPEGVRLLSGADVVLCHLKAPVEVEEVTPGAAPEGAAAEPEVIAKGKKEEEAEEEG